MRHTLASSPLLEPILRYTPPRMWWWTSYPAPAMAPVTQRLEETARVRYDDDHAVGHVLLPTEAPDDDPDADRFLDLLARQHDDYPRRAALHHPAVAVGMTDLPDTGCWAVTGYPGAGNMVLQSVLNEIDALRTCVARPPELDTLGPWAQHHEKAVQGWVRRLTEQLGRPLEQSVVSPGNLGQASVRMTFTDGHALILNHLPYAGFVGRNFGAHTPWTTEASRFFHRFGYRRVYLAVRNPIAMIASNAAKTVRPLEHALHDEAWFRDTTGQMVQYLEQADAQRGAFTVVRYEDLTQTPVPTIQQLGRDAQLDLSDAQAAAIWDKVGFKPVTDAGAEHLFDPTADKTQHYSRRHLAVMREEGLDRWFEPFGYALPDPASLPHDGMQPVGDAEKTPSALYGRIDPRSMHEVRDPTLPLWVRSTDPALAEQAQQQIAGTWLRRIFGTLDDHFGKLALRAR